MTKEARSFHCSHLIWWLISSIAGESYTQLLCNFFHHLWVNILSFALVFCSADETAHISVLQLLVNNWVMITVLQANIAHVHRSILLYFLISKKNLIYFCFCGIFLHSISVWMKKVMWVKLIDLCLLKCVIVVSVSVCTVMSVLALCLDRIN